MSGISVLILTLDEELNIGDCIDSCAWSDDIVVFDSGSQDRTREIALGRGARVVERAFDHYAGQRTAALNEVNYRNPWVLMVDADERVPDDLAAELQRTVAQDDGTVLYRMRRQDFFLGKWLRRSSGYPTWFGRLMRVGRVRIDRAVNEEYIADGPIGALQAHLHHFPFNKGIAYWFDRHNRYSSMEATAKLGEQRQALRVAHLFSRDPIDRRRAIKQLGYRLPLRPLIVFLHLYVVRFGFLDGRAGCCFSLMRACYEFSIDLKVMELTRRARGRPV